MNFLAEVLSSVDEMDLFEINKKVPELKSSIDTTKSEIWGYIENIYVKYNGRPKRNRNLLNKAHHLEEEVKTLSKNANRILKKELLESSEELEKHIDALERLRFTIHVVSLLCRINEDLINITDMIDLKKYLECMKLICNMETLLNEIPDEDYIEVLHKLKFNMIIKKTTILNELNTIITDSIIIGNDTDTYAIKVKKDIDNFQQALSALYFKNSVIYPLHSFAKSLWNYILVPVVNHRIMINVEDNGNCYTLKFTIVDKERPSYLDVFANLKTVLEFLNDHCNVKISDDLTSLGYIGLDIRDNLSELIIKNCLQYTIPSNTEDLQKYNSVIEHTKLLEQVLKDCHIFVEDTTSILEYANNVDILFINKKCNEYISISRTIMEQDLHDMEEVGVPYNPENQFDCNPDEFMQCSVSKSVLELLRFTEKIIQQALSASDVCGGRLFYTVQNIYRMYTHFVPEYHQKLLETIPQQVALFHNNCLYISFQLTQWNAQYSPKMSAVLSRENCGFKDEIFQVRKVGSEIFTAYVEGQLKQIDDIMKQSGFQGSTLEALEPITEKSIRQCLRQQELLKTVWHKVLSYPLYNKTLGIILNSLCNIIINVVIKFEDISCNAAEQLVEIFKVIFNRGPKLFTDPKEINLYVSSWYKLNELNFVLSSGLLDINDRWADGKGPLAMQFKPLELKQLIRALFQNTDRRSAVLAKIQE